VTGELVPASEYRKAAFRGVMIAPDIAPFEFPGEPGNIIDGRAARRELMRSRGLEEMGNEMPKWMKERQYEQRNR
jgi:hypothetical protein